MFTGENRLIAEKYGQKRPMAEQKKWGKNFYGLSKQHLELVSVFKEASRNFRLISLLEKASCKF